MKKILTILALALGTTAAITAITPTIEKSVNKSACDKWVDSVYNSLTPRERVAQLIFPKFVPTQGEKSLGRLDTLVGINQVGGLLFTDGKLDQYVEMTNYAQSLAKVPLMMVFDGEWGLSMRIANTPRFPRNIAIGALADTSLVYEYGKEVARECRLVGIPVNFAPVVDVNTNPANPVIGDRSFGSDSKKVSQLSLLYSRGLEDGGVQAVAKHFPGHGDTDSDSHKTLPTVNLSKECLDSTHLVPFRDYINAGFSGIMTAHLTLPYLDPELTPASLSNAITTGLLKNELGFEGLIYTDALGMKGAQVEGANNAVMALKAGADVLEASRNPIGDIDTIMIAIQNGELSEELIAERCKRVLKYKYILGLPSEQPIVMEGLSEIINSPEAIMLNRKLSAGAITVVKNTDDVLPIGNLANNKIAVVSIGKKPADIFSQFCAYYTNVDTFSCVTSDNVEEILAHEVVITGITDAMPPTVSQVDMLSGAKEGILTFFCDPYKLTVFNDAISNAKGVVVAYDNTPLLQEYAAQAIFGGIDVTGTLPLPLEGVAPIGFGIELKKSRLGFSTPLNEGLDASLSYKVDSIIAECIAAGAFPGCQLVIAKNGNVVVNNSYGTIMADGDSVEWNTVYDLASVSKALGTLPSVMKGYDLGLFELDEPASKYIPGLRGTGKDDITIRELLFHETGMPASLNMYASMGAPGHKGYNDFQLRDDIVSSEPTELLDIETAKGVYVGKITYDTIMSHIYNIPLRKDKSYNYSCLNFCLLMDLNQQATGIDHRSFSHDSIYAPIGAFTTCYRPSEIHPLSKIAATEMDSIMRHQLVHGYVHDELNSFSGGVQGNAGLFSNALDLAKVCQMWLNNGNYGDVQILSPETVELFTTTKSPTCHRGLGFDKPNTEHPENSSTCEEADPSVYGHLGFTGTVFWVDPANDVIFIFLNNRVNPSRVNRAFSRLNPRPALFREVYRSMKDK